MEQQMYSCPNCGEIVYYGEPVCRNCGMELDWSAVEESPPQDEYQYQDYGQDQQQWTPPPEDYQQSGYGQYYQPPPPADKRGKSGKAGKPPAQKQPYGENAVALQKRKKIIKIVVLSVVCVIIAAAAIALGLGFNPFVSNNNGNSGTTTPSSGNTTPTATVSGPIEIVKFIIDPAVIPEGNTSTLYWEVTGANQVSIDQDIGTVSPIGQQVISPSSTTTYTLTASNDAGSISESATISVNLGAPRITFTANPSTIVMGGTSTLSWEVTGASNIKLGHDAIPASGTREVSPESSTTYTITATNSAGVTEATAKVTIGASGKPTITTFGANPDFLNPGESATLEWYVTNADSVSINQGIGTVAIYGSETVSPDSTTTYKLTASNSAGSSSLEVTVTISSDGKPVINDFYPTPQFITTGGSSTLTWNVAGATSIFLDPGNESVSATGTKSVNPASTTTYTLSATNDNGTTTATTTVTFSQVPSPEISFDADPDSIPSGTSSTLTWNVTGADQVSIDHGIGTVTASGTHQVTPSTTTKYTLTATKQGIDFTADTTVSVQQP